MRTLATVTRDTSALISLDNAKTWLRVTGTDEDTLIQALISGGVAYAENFLNKTVGSNTYIMSLSNFTDVVSLMRPPVSAVTKIEYYDTEGVLIEFDLTKIRLNNEEGYLSLKQDEQWPSDVANEVFPIHIYYTCTGLFAGNQGDDILDAIKMTIGYRYDFRDDPNQRWRKASDNILYPLRNRPFE